MSDAFTNSQVDNENGLNFHHGAMNFSVQYSVPNKIDSTLNFTTEYTPSVAVNRGKHPIVAKSITTKDVDSSTVLSDWEDRNDKAKTEYRS